MNRKERIKKFNQLRKAAIEAEEAAEMEKEKKLLADIRKGAREINDFFWDLTGGEWQINCFLTPIGDANNEFSAAVQMAAWDGLLDLCIYNTPDERETTVRVSHGKTVADAQAIRNQCSSYYSEWIFAHGDEVCDMIMDKLEEEYM